MTSYRRTLWGHYTASKTLLWTYIQLNQVFWACICGHPGSGRPWLTAVIIAGRCACHYGVEKDVLVIRLVGIQWFETVEKTPWPYWGDRDVEHGIFLQAHNSIFEKLCHGTNFRLIFFLYCSMRASIVYIFWLYFTWTDFLVRLMSLQCLCLL